ncbi:MAG TPA: OmpA family protein [Bacteroidales bacterium]|nr:OmpA family protein [Bacteroidales bacterium]
MRNYIYILFILLVIWIAGSGYWYVCRVRGDCGAYTQTGPDQMMQSFAETDTGQRPADSLQTLVDEAENYLVSAGVQRVYFDIASAVCDMSAISGEYLNKLKFYLENNPGKKVIVTGHTDSSGTASFNEKLGQKRADYVKDFLVRTGILSGCIDCSSMSFREPVASNDNSEGRAKNRRTEIILLK